jgi:ubiquinone/menaquinone biosynthesis C-methylase UbiE
MAEKFDVNQRHKLDNPRRREMLPPEEVLAAFNLTPGTTLADIGCGIGYFTFPAAKLLGPGGKVYAMDISATMLSEVDMKRQQEGIINIETVQTGEYDLRLKPGTADTGLLCNVLHEIEDKDCFLKEIFRILKTEGRIIIIEWRKQPGAWGPPLEERMGEPEAAGLLDKNGFTNIIIQPMKTDFYTVQAYK